MDLIEEIGPFLGIFAFLGFAVLAFLIFMQAREVRRLREWAGRAPERSLEADDATGAVAEARGEIHEEDRAGRLTRARWAVTDRLFHVMDGVDRRLPFDPRWLLAIIALAFVAAVFITSGFGLVGDDQPARDGKGNGARSEKQTDETTTQSTTTATEPALPSSAVVLNATQGDGTTGIPGLAVAVADGAITPAGVGTVDTGDAPEGADTSLIMFAPGAEEAANELAAKLEPELGQLAVEPMSIPVTAAADGADVAVIVGLDLQDYTAPAT